MSNEAGLEGEEKASQAAWELMDLGVSQKVKLVTSELSLAEVLIDPLKAVKGIVPVNVDQRGLKLTPATLNSLYLEIVRDREGLSVVAIDRSILILSAHHRAETQSLKLPDAIHLATAEQTGCDIVVSGDKRLRSTSAFSFRRIGVTSNELNQLIAEVA